MTFFHLFMVNKFLFVTYYPADYSINTKKEPAPQAPGYSYIDPSVPRPPPPHEVTPFGLPSACMLHHT